MNKETIGILDIGSQKIKFLILSLDEKNFIKIHSKNLIFSSGVKKGNIVDLEKLSLVIKQCIATAEKDVNSEFKEIYVGLGSVNFNFNCFGVSRDIGSYEVEEKKDLQSVVDSSVLIFENCNPSEKIIHLINSGFILDKKNFVENPLKMKCDTLQTNFSFISVNSNTLLSFDNLLKSCGLKVKRYFYTPYAISILSADQEIFNRGFVSIDFGYETTSVTIFENGNLIFSKILPLGSHFITKDLAKAFDIDFNLSENIKINFKNLMKNDLTALNNIKKKISLELVDTVINARVDEIIDHITEVLKFSNSIKKSSRKIVLSGGGSGLEIFNEKLKKRFGGVVENVKQAFPIKNTEFNIFSDYLACLGIAKLIFFKDKKEILRFKSSQKSFFQKFYSLFLEN
jgi:cell division protein FtsA